MDSITGNSTLQVSLDGQPIQLPHWLAESLHSIRTYIECIAMKQHRVLWSLLVDGIKLDLSEPEAEIEPCRTVRAQTISYDELAERLLSSGRDKARELISTIESFSLTVVINDGALAQRLWYSWEPELRELLFSLRAYQELETTKAVRVMNASRLVGHLDQLEFLGTEIETLFQTDSPEGIDLIDFSEIIDYTLIPWLRSLDQLFEEMHADFRNRAAI